MMSEVSVKYRVELEDSAATIQEFQSILFEVQRGVGLISRLDYLTLAWQRAMKRMDMRSFLSITLSTMSTLNMITRLLKSAETAQLAYNAALTIGRLLEGPSGWAILAAAGVGVGIGIGASYRPTTADKPFVLAEEVAPTTAKELETIARREAVEERESYSAQFPG